MNNDRSWMLNPEAISAARNCIHITKIELGISLKLSHPQFIEMLGEYADLTDSRELKDSVVELMTYYNQRNPSQSAKSSAKASSHHALLSAEAQSINKYIREAHEPDYPQLNQRYQASGHEKTAAEKSSEITFYRGKEYPTYNTEGKKFKGLYRGQPSYA